MRHLPSPRLIIAIKNGVVHTLVQRGQSTRPPRATRNRYSTDAAALLLNDLRFDSIFQCTACTFYTELYVYIYMYILYPYFLT
jgi:uncharacterized membrane protein YagU involved in acid resistance